MSHLKAHDGIRTAVATLGFDGFDDRDFADAFELLPRTGFTAVEFNCWYARNLTPAGIRSIAERAAAAHVTPVSLHLPGFHPGPSPADLARDAARWCWVIEAAQRLDARIVKATGASRGEAGGIESLELLLEQIVPVARDAGVVIALENHAGNVLEFAEDYERLLTRFSEPSVGLCLDSGHFAASGVDPVGIAERFRGRIVHVDLKDCAGPGKPFVPFGEGVVDFSALLDVLERDGYSGYAVIEYPRGDADADTAVRILERGAELVRGRAA